MQGNSEFYIYEYDSRGISSRTSYPFRKRSLLAFMHKMTCKFDVHFSMKYSQICSFEEIRLVFNASSRNSLMMASRSYSNEGSTSSLNVVLYFVIKQRRNDPISQDIIDIFQEILIDDLCFVENEYRWNTFQSNLIE